MASQGMPLGQARMVEVLGRIADHAQLFHHPARALIFRNSKRDQPGKSKPSKSMLNDGLCPLRCQTAPPIVRTEPPADFDSRHKGRVERWHGKPNKPEKHTVFKQLGGKQAKSAPLEMLFNAVDHLVRLLRRQQSRHALHHPRVGIQPLKRLPVRVPPATQQQAPSGEDFRHADRLTFCEPMRGRGSSRMQESRL